VLFSNKQIADYINQNFEPVWQSVRPVPIVHIDFGNGKVLTRTLHGNIATYLCNDSGQVLDILPGIYQPVTYLDRLHQFKMLARYAGKAATPDQLAYSLVSYHETIAKQLAQKVEPSRFIELRDISKASVEGGVKIMLTSPGMTAAKAEREAHSAAIPDLHSNSELANWKALIEDTRLNETDRRGQIHTMLAARKLTSPGAVTKWLYKEVLHADLDDPYLGLGPTLFASYPFKDDLAMKP
jgi:hypothetical protein